MTCKCGCGQVFTPSSGTLWRLKRGERAGFVRGHHVKGSANPKWIGGRVMSSNGYVYILMPEHPNALRRGMKGYVAEHRLAMSSHLGRALRSDEVVHHINEVKTDYRIENLTVETRASHAAHHTTGHDNGNWQGGRTPIRCATCFVEFLPLDRRNDYGAKFCGRACFYRRTHGVTS